MWLLSRAGISDKKFGKLNEKVEHHTSKLEKPARNIGLEAANIGCPFCAFGRVMLDFFMEFPEVFALLSLIRARDNTSTRNLGFRYSTSVLAISANRLSRRPPAKTTHGPRQAAPRCFVDEGGVLLSDLR